MRSGGVRKAGKTHTGGRLFREENGVEYQMKVSVSHDAWSGEADPDTHGTCIIVGAGTIQPEDLPVKKKPGDFLMAADAGYMALLSAGQVPDLLIGDFDSMKQPEFAGETILLPVEKDDTDTMFCVKEGLARGFTSFVLYGALGGSRISHTIANLQLLSYVKQSGGNAVLAAGGTRIQAAGAGECLHFDKTMAGTVSVLAVSEQADVSLRNLYYAGEHIRLQRSFPLGVSNHFTGERAEIEVHAGEVLVITEWE